MINNSIFNILITLIITYLLFGVFLFFNQRSMIYFPNNQNFENCEGFKDYQKMDHDGTRFYYNKGSSDNVLIYYHGNAGSACDRSYVKSTFEKGGSSLIFVEYAGYSNDNKKPSKKLILQDVKNIHNFVEKNSFKNVIVYGQSIGTGAASYHASLGKVDHLILVTTFSRLLDIAQATYIIYPASIILREDYDNRKWLQNFEGNIIMLHGDNDRIISPKFSQKLFDEIPIEKKEYVLIKGKGHNDIWSSDVFKNKLVKFIKGRLN